MAGGRKSVLMTIAGFSRRWTEFKCQGSLPSTHTFFYSSGLWGGKLSRSDGKKLMYYFNQDGLSQSQEIHETVRKQSGCWSSISGKD